MYCQQYIFPSLAAELFQSFTAFGKNFSKFLVNLVFGHHIEYWPERLDSPAANRRGSCLILSAFVGTLDISNFHKQLKLYKTKLANTKNRRFAGKS